MVLSDEMFRLVERALHFSRLSGGAFDISYAGVGQLYDYRARHPARATQPSPRARQAVGWQHLMLDAQARSLRFARPGMRIDLGGFAKGHAVDNAAAILARRGIRHAIVSRRRRQPRHRRPARPALDGRRSAIRAGRPRWWPCCRWRTCRSRPRATTSATSSSDGVRCHHLIDPRTGRSPSSVHSVTILADDGLTSEALSKSVFVLGVDAGHAARRRRSRASTRSSSTPPGRLHFSSGLLRSAGQ